MGSGDESKPSILYDPSYASQPLLSAVDDPATDDDENYSPINYQHGPRPLRDLPALLLFLLLSLSTIALGLVAVARRNPAATRASFFVFDPATSSCVLSSFNSLSSSSSPFLKDLSWTLVVTLILAGPIALAVLWLLRHYAKQVVYAALPFFILIPAFVNVYWFATCALSHGCRHSFPLAYRILALLFIFLLIAIILWIIVANWHRVELTVRIVRIAAAALAGNMSLLAVLPSLGLGLVVYFTPLVVFLVYSTWNGKVVPKEKEGAGGEYYLCVWRQDGWVPAYFALAIITMVWSVAAMVEAQVYVISGTIAQWYFSKEGSKPSRSLRSSLR